MRCPAKHRSLPKEDTPRAADVLVSVTLPFLTVILRVEIGEAMPGGQQQLHQRRVKELQSLLCFHAVWSVGAKKIVNQGLKGIFIQSALENVVHELQTQINFFFGRTTINKVEIGSCINEDRHSRRYKDGKL